MYLEGAPQRDVIGLDEMQDLVSELIAHALAIGPEGFFEGYIQSLYDNEEISSTAYTDLLSIANLLCSTDTDASDTGPISAYFSNLQFSLSALRRYAYKQNV